MLLGSSKVLECLVSERLHREHSNLDVPSHFPVLEDDQKKPMQALSNQDQVTKFKEWWNLQDEDAWADWGLDGLIGPGGAFT